VADVGHLRAGGRQSFEGHLPATCGGMQFAAPSQKSVAE
jgi:hypothetical protein